MKEQSPTVRYMWRNAGTTHEEPVSDHIVTFAAGRHDQGVQDQQNQEAASSKLPHQATHAEKHSLHQTDGSANGEMQQYLEQYEWLQV